MTNKEKYLTPGTIWVLEEGKSCNIKGVNACMIRFANAAFVVYSTIRNRYAADEAIFMSQESISKEAFLEMWRPEPDLVNAMNEVIKDDGEDKEPFEKWLGRAQIWESVIGNNTGTVVITEFKPVSEKVICRQLINPGKMDEHLSGDFIEFDLENFYISFKPAKKQYISSLGITIKDTASPKGDSTTNYLKMDGDKAQFESGAIRYTKTGKGRYDLIPGDIIADIISHANDMFEEKAVRIVSKANVVEDAYRGDPKDRFVHTIINVIIDHYAPSDIVEDNMGLTANEVTFISFMNGFFHMLKDLAVHYENGAEKYGVDNWKKGIPVIGGDRGGSFMDSAMRHLTQYLIGLEDEPHYISCIWNCVCGLWTLHNQQMHPDKK